MRAIAIINQKGGCGKTTSAINLSAVLARAGKRVMLIDMDPQGHCAAGLGIPEQRIELDIGDAMLAIGQRPIDPAKLLWRAVRNMDLAPSRMKLAGLEAIRGGLADLPDKERRLHQVLEKFSAQYDIAVIDCPPSIGLLTFNALATADMALIPVETGFFSLQGATRQVNTIKTLSKRLGVNIPVWLLPTLHDAKNTVAADLLEELHRRFKDRVTPITIRNDQRLREAASFGQTIIDYAPGSTGAEDYGRLAVWTLEHLTTRMPLPEDQREVAVEAPLVVAAAARGPASVSANVLQPASDVASDQAMTPNTSELKPVSRAEDVARRAQEFLRRIALGRSAQAANLAAAQAPVDAMPDSGPTNETPRGTPHDYAHTITHGVLHGGSNTSPKVGTNGTSHAYDTDGQSATATLERPAATQLAGVLPARQVLTIAPSQVEQLPATKPVAAATQRLLGVRETSQGVLFVQPIAIKDGSGGSGGGGGPRLIAIAGSFNDWSPAKHIMKRNQGLGIHELCLRLPPGKHTYRLVVDGVWQNDPHNTNMEPNPFGEVNNVVYVGQV